MTFEDFVQEYMTGKAPCYRMLVSRIHTPEYSRDFYAYSVALYATNKQETEVFSYRRGSALTAPPETADVLQALALDASCATQGETKRESFELYLQEYGSGDAAQDRDTFEACLRNYESMRRVFGKVRLKDLLARTEEDDEA